MNQAKLGALGVSLFVAATFSPTRMRAQTEWTHVVDRPVLEYGAAGEWDDGAVFWPAVIRDGEILRMWYAGGDEVLGSGTVQIGYAWSLGGISWHRYSGNPVLSAGQSWEAGITVSPAVIKDGNTFKMWYGAASVPPRLIGYATSADGTNWNKHPDPVLQPGPAGDWDSSIIGPGTVRKENDAYRMWYWGGLGNWPGSVIQIGLAFSDDGIHWVKHDDPSTASAPFAASDPVLEVGGAGDWDHLRVWGPAVLATSTGYEMWYAGRKDHTTSEQLVGYATSQDGMDWQKSQDNPVIRTRPVWGYSYLTSAVVAFDDLYHLWYTSFTFADQARNQRAEIGYAVSPALANVTGEKEVPARYRLFQNHPNPFNSTTTLRYDLPEPAEVMLVIYDILGRRVKALAQGMEEAGSKSVTWDATDEVGRPVGTGVFLYRIRAGDLSRGPGRLFTQTRRMVVLK